jgi:hypothetical protein
VEAIARSPLYRQYIHHIQPLTAPSIGLARKPHYSRCEVIRLWQVNRHDLRTALSCRSKGRLYVDLGDAFGPAPLKDKAKAPVPTAIVSPDERSRNSALIA